MDPRRLLMLASGMVLWCSALPGFAQADLAALEKQVADTERAFAKTMADRDHAPAGWRSARVR